MLYINEAVARELLGFDEAIEVVEEAFGVLHDGRAESFPVVSATGLTPEQRWAIKSARDMQSESVGCKIGTYWPDNRSKGLATHASTVLLLNVETGFPRAILEASHLTAVRTAAADAVAVKHLARADASVLAILGAGHQGYFDMRAICRVRPINRILVWGRNTLHVKHFLDQGSAEGFPVEAASLRVAVESAHVIVTATAAQGPLFYDTWVSPGTHVSAMGADAPGKQELPIELVMRSSLFADSIAQATSIGEFQHVGGSMKDRIRTLGSVIRLASPGRTREEETSIFDSSGMAIQDLAVCQRVCAKALSQGLGVNIR